MKKLLYLFFFISLFGYSQTPITNDNFQEAINTCLTTNPVDGLCSDNEYGAMPDWDVSDVKDMSNAFEDKSNFNGDISSWDVSSVTNMYSRILLGEPTQYMAEHGLTVYMYLEIVSHTPPCSIV